MESLPSTWITGEEFALERRRLLETGQGFPSPAYLELRARLAERDDSLFERFGRPFVTSHGDQWIAISLHGETIIRPTGSDAMRLARERFGEGNFAFRKLNEIGAEPYRALGHLRREM